MEDRKRKLKEIIREKQANFWEWRGTNPYRQGPLEILGLEKQEKVIYQVISQTVKKLEAQIRTGQLIWEEPLTPSQAKDLLTHPVTRVFCESMRIPPVEISKDELKELERLAGVFKSSVELPWPEAVACRWEAIAGGLLKHLSQDEDQDGRPDGMPDGLPDGLPDGRADFGPGPELARHGFTGVSFNPRLRKEVVRVVRTTH